MTFGGPEERVAVMIVLGQSGLGGLPTPSHDM